MKKSRALAVSAATAALALAALPAVAADAPGPATAQGWALNYTANGAATTDQAAVFSSTSNPANNAPLVGVTKSGRVNLSTGLYYPRTSTFDASTPFAGDASVAISAPVVGTTGIPTRSTSAGRIESHCTTDADGNAVGHVVIESPVPLGTARTPAPNTVVYIPAGTNANNYDMRVVYNEQNRLENGQLQVTAMAVYFDVADSGLVGSGPVTGSAKLGITTCGKVTNADLADIPVASAGVAGAGLGIAALVGGIAAVRRRKG
ncbi:MAG: hypothetical protein Q4G43_02460 [Mobilicoccus sp.]|nr:hypothetical protein [Mobilicoccus sp.]